MQVYSENSKGTARPEPSITVPPETLPDTERLPFEPEPTETSAANDSEDEFVLFSDHGFEPLATPGSVPWASEKPDANNDERREEIIEKEKITPTGPFTLTEQQAHILDYLNTNFVKLAAVINGFDNTVAADIPRYAISDARRSKLFMFSEELAEALKDFSARHEINQRDLVESAVIDFMLRYGGSAPSDLSFRRLLCA